MTDNSDELLGSGDLDASPIDQDDQVDIMSYTRSSQSLPQGYVDHPNYNNMSQSRSSGPSFSSIDRSNSQFDSRMSYASNNNNMERFVPVQQPLTQSRHLLQQLDLTYSYPQSEHQQQSSVYNDVAPQGWPPRVERLQPTWPANNDRQPGSMSGHRQGPYSPSTPSSTWSNPSPGGPTTPSSTSPNYFPTLTTPFYPGQPSVSDYQTVSSPSTSHPVSTPSPLYESVSHAQPSMMSKEYAPRVYSSTGTIQLSSSYGTPPSSRPPLGYPQSTLPRVRTTLEYPNSQPSSAPSSGPVFWSRE